MAHLPRGIAPELLVSQVKNTMPYVFTQSETVAASFIPFAVLRDYESRMEGADPLSHFEYFKLCLFSHYLTCATPVPTDVDNQIRLKLWPENLPLEIALPMVDLVLASHHWDFTQVSSRFAFGAPGTDFQKEALGGHQGEWFTVACAAYCAFTRNGVREKNPLVQEKRAQLFSAISDEVHRHSEIFGSLWKAEAGLSCLVAAANLAHNFGDLDRVMDMWDLSIGDPLRLEFYKLAVLPFDTNKRLRYRGRLWVAGELYKAPIDGSSMAFENHRHFALRKPRSLRQARPLLVPNGPFFDQWGDQVARYLRTPEGEPSEETFEVMAALKHGWERLPKTLGYGRALRSIFAVHPSLHCESLEKVYRSRAVLETPRETFEKKWNDEALKHMDDIPSRA